MVRDAEATKKRLLDAAAAEFAEFGIAGARVDRIARAAKANKSMIYAYFGDKGQLFDAVFAAHVVAFTEQVRFDATDLPGYAGRSFDLYEDNPATLRLATWYQLERPDGEPLQVVVASNRSKLADIERAQKSGVLPTRFTPVELLAVVRSVAMSWHTQTPELGASAPGDRARRRQVVVESVRLLVGA